MAHWFEEWHGAKLPATVVSGLSTGGGSTSMSTGVALALSTKASVGHTHPQADVTDLTSTLSAIASSLSGLASQISTKAAGVHVHAAANSTAAGFAPQLPANSTTFLRSDLSWASPPSGGSTSMSTGVANALSTKASVGHTHAQADVTDLTSTLSAISAAVSTKAAGVHVHAVANTTAAGFGPMLPANSTTFLRSDGTYASPPAGGPGASWSSVSFNFGYTKTRTLRVTIIDGAVTSTTTRIIFSPRALLETHDNGGDAEPFTVMAAPETGQFIAYVRGSDSPIGGIVKAMYQVN